MVLFTSFLTADTTNTYNYHSGIISKIIVFQFVHSFHSVAPLKQWLVTTILISVRHRLVIVPRNIVFSACLLLLCPRIDDL